MNAGMIGELIRLYRAVNNIGVREFAKTIGVSPSTVSRIENGYECDQHTMLLLIQWLFKTERREDAAN